MDDVGSGLGSVLDPFTIVPTPVSPVAGLSIYNADLSMDFVGKKTCTLSRISC